ncbi:unnamed protein product, partial [Rotaria sp. Silwood2]
KKPVFSEHSITNELIAIKMKRTTTPSPERPDFLSLN